MSEILLLAAAKRGVAVPPPPHHPAVLGELACSIMLHPQRGVRRMPRELAYLEAATAFRLSTASGGLAAWSWGDPGAPLVGLVHGWEGHGAQLGAFAAPLVAAGFRVLAFDAPGHGDSPGDEASVPLLARLLVEVERQVGPFFAFVGHSMGAAAAAMVTHYGARPRGLVLLAPPQSQLGRVIRVADRMQLAGDVRAAFLQAVERRTESTYAETDLLAVAQRRPCDLLVFHDPEDGDTSYAEAEAVVAAWAGARMVPCPGRGHYRILATPEVSRQAVEFIAGLR